MWQEVVDNRVATQGGKQLDLGMMVLMTMSLDQLLLLMTCVT